MRCTMEPFEIEKYKEIALRRKWWTIIPFLLILLAAVFYTLKVPEVYEAETLILILPQKVPQRLVLPIVESDIYDRLKTMMEQVKSRTNLESAILKYALYRDSELPLDEKVAHFRRQIRIDIQRGG